MYEQEKRMMDFNIFKYIKQIFLNCYRSNEYKREQVRIAKMYDEEYITLTKSDIQFIIEEPSSLSTHLNYLYFLSKSVFQL